MRRVIIFNPRNDFEKGLTKYFETGFLEYIEKVTVAVAGLGGLGSNILNSMVRSGFRKFLICDYDIVEASNLNRQLYMSSDIGEYKTHAIKKHLLEINDALEIDTMEIKLTKENMPTILDGYEIIFEAFDRAEYKKMLFECMCKTNKILVFGSGMAGFNLIDSNSLEIKKIKENIYIVGDGVSGVSRSLPPLAPKVTAVASLMAGVALDLIFRRYKNNI